MRMREDMARKCKECASRPPWGEVVIEPSHYEGLAGTQEEKDVRLLVAARDGCCEGSGWPTATPRIDTHMVNGQVVRVMVVVGGEDPNKIKP